ncbi:dihydrodipicolinate synthase family protein [Alloyangia pacifica]|uniref:4-hydroxy-tetrahydrodipicolinate synthase n=1 Tax=Alloyangia pacifica TaxID=311180 RepID=A0A1I6V275_9RHOB|nr:dihydrodipicolinate synthase family protein [Alloyangia pacifica]SDI88499.1 4-hydroxy-tetrahydrodipicolinate synthase [Alloyangia pacifica]SFT07657.1 4-hydroxy-tetrahydrodipicolinate synthase [Alloyangia pacifica]
MTLFTGLSAFPLTPIDDSGKLKPELLQRFLERIVSAGVDSIGLLGSTGGYAYLTVEERERTLRAAVESVAGRTPLIVGIGALTTDVAEELARDAQKAGADGLLLAPMSYQPLTEEEVFRHFESVAAAGGLPLCIYNNPGTTKFTFSLNLIARLAKLPNVTAVKMPLPADGDYAGEMQRLRAMTPEGFVIGYSGDWGAKDSLLAGGTCWYSVIAGLLPEPALALTRAVRTGNATEAERIDMTFAPLWALFREFGSFRVMFAIAETLGFATFTPPRPILALQPADRERVETALRPLMQFTG